MIPVEQSIIHDPTNGNYGDCYRACIASILELDIKEVPHFMSERDSKRVVRSIIRFLYKYGYAMYNTKEYEYDKEDEEYHIISGISPRFSNVKHAVVGKRGEMIHDPHPDKTGVSSIEYYGILFKIN